MDNNSKDCYFWIDSSIPEEERMVSFMCVKCHKEKHPDLDAWFWEGSIKGYGPYDYICECGEVIHKVKNKTGGLEKQSI